MRVIVEKIPPQGTEVAASSADAWASEAAALALEGEVEQLDFEVLVTKVLDHLRVSGHLDADAVRPCDRCQADVRVQIGGPVDLYYAPSPKHIVLDELGLEVGDLEIGYFDGEGLEMGTVLSEQLALWLPDRLRCGDVSDAVQVDRIGPAGPCRVPAHDGGPELKPDSPFAGLRLPE